MEGKWQKSSLKFKVNWKEMQFTPCKFVRKRMLWKCALNYLSNKEF